MPLRRVVGWDEAHGRGLVCLTIILHLAASTGAAIYKQRWQIELFFTALKQSQKVRRLRATANAVYCVFMMSYESGNP